MPGHDVSGWREGHKAAGLRQPITLYHCRDPDGKGSSCRFQGLCRGNPAPAASSQGRRPGSDTHSFGRRLQRKPSKQITTRGHTARTQSQPTFSGHSSQQAKLPPHLWHRSRCA